MPKQIEIKLRAFSLLQKTDITNIGSEIVAMLDDKLKITLAKDRLLKRSSSKEDKEHDLI